MLKFRELNFRGLLESVKTIKITSLENLDVCGILASITNLFSLTVVACTCKVSLHDYVLLVNKGLFVRVQLPFAQD